MILTYTGHEKNYETNLTYMMARYYSQGYGVFISPDKFDLLEKINSLTSQIEDPQKREQLENLLINPLFWNKYTYCLDNLTNRVDKDGKWSVPEVFIAVTIVTVVTAYVISKKVENHYKEETETRLFFNAVDNLVDKWKDGKLNLTDRQRDKLEDIATSRDKEMVKVIGKTLADLSTSMPGTTVTGPLPSKDKEIPVMLFFQLKEYVSDKIKKSNSKKYKKYFNDEELRELYLLIKKEMEKIKKEQEKK